MPSVWWPVRVRLCGDVCLDGLNLFRACHGHQLTDLTDPTPSDGLHTFLVGNRFDLPEIGFIHAQQVTDCGLAAPLFTDQNNHAVKLAPRNKGPVDTTGKYQPGTLACVLVVITLHDIVKKLHHARFSIPFEGLEPLHNRVDGVRHQIEVERVFKHFRVIYPVLLLKVCPHLCVTSVSPFVPLTGEFVLILCLAGHLVESDGSLIVLLNQRQKQ